MSRPAARHKAARHKAEKAKRPGFAYSAAAAAATGVVVSGGVAATAVGGAAAAEQVAKPITLTADDLARTDSASRSGADRRTQVDQKKVAALSAAGGAAVTAREKINGSSADPRVLARALMPEYGLKVSEFGCLDRIWTQESNWNVHADNPHSSAYGIPQALPGSKMASAGPDWANSAETQIRWGLGYIRDRYGSACRAWGFKAGHGWY